MHTSGDLQHPQGVWFCTGTSKYTKEKAIHCMFFLLPLPSFFLMVNGIPTRMKDTYDSQVENRMQSRIICIPLVHLAFEAYRCLITYESVITNAPVAVAVSNINGTPRKQLQSSGQHQIKHTEPPVYPSVNSNATEGVAKTNKMSQKQLRSSTQHLILLQHDIADTNTCLIIITAAISSLFQCSRSRSVVTINMGTNRQLWKRRTLAVRAFTPA